MDIGFLEDQTSYISFFFFTSIEAHLYFSGETTVTGAGRTQTYIVYILFSHHIFINRESCATVNFSFSALLVSRYKVTNKSTWINCKSRHTALYTPSCDENST